MLARRVERNTEWQHMLWKEFEAADFRRWIRPALLEVFASLPITRMSASLSFLELDRACSYSSTNAMLLYPSASSIFLDPLLYDVCYFLFTIFGMGNLTSGANKGEWNRAKANEPVPHDLTFW